MKAWASRIPSQSKVLDVGAGIGRYRPFFAHCQYFTHDFGEEPGTRGKYTKLDYQSDITQIPVPEKFFDVILCTEVLEHIPEPIKALKEIHRILKPGGRLLVTAPLGSLLHQEPYHYYGGFTPHWYYKFLPEVGFEIESLEANQGHFSLFGQEAQRFSAYVDPRRTYKQGFKKWLGLVLVWLITLPMTRGLFPLLGRPLDRLGLEGINTAGYLVAAHKR